MQLDREPKTAIAIRSYAAGRIEINRTVYTGPVIVTPHDVIEHWAPPPLAALSIADLALALQHGPELVLLGTGTAQRFPPARLGSDVMRGGVGLEVMDTGAACRTFNVLVAEGRRVVAALLPL